MPTNDKFHAWVPFALVFAAGAAVMVIELVAARMIARHVGASLYTWTSIIGVVLAGLTAGNGIGGVLADRVPPERIQALLGLLFVLASLCAFSILWTHWYVFQLPGVWSWPLRILAGSVLAFFIPSVVLGAISPVVATWAVLHSHALGHTIGGLYAWGSMGAIAGTLLTGFVLIPFFGTITVIATVGLVLAAIAVPLYARHWTFAWLFLAAVLTLVTVSGWSWSQDAARAIGVQRDQVAIWFDETAYQTVEVRGDRFGARAVHIDGLIHGYIDPARPEELFYGYLDIFRALMESRIDPADAPATLALGGGSYTFPRWLAAAYPEGRTVVAEIDPGVTLANRVATDLAPEPGFEIVHLDARQAVVELLAQDARFDFIVGDAFRDWSVPAHLTTVEFNRMLRALMPDEGILMTNVIDSFARARMLGAYYNTLREVFEHVAVFAMTAPDERGYRDTFVVAASARPLDLARVRAAAATRGKRLHAFDRDELEELRARSRGVVLTDDHAPVEHLLFGLMVQPRR